MSRDESRRSDARLTLEYLADVWRLPASAAKPLTWLALPTGAKEHKKIK
jgi:hypothetical protein